MYTLELYAPQILSYFHGAPRKVYSFKELRSVLEENRGLWHLALRTNAAEFVSFLEREGELRVRTFHSPAYNRQITRYSWANASIYELVQALNSLGYLSHASALAVHKLTDKDIKALYLNVEQSQKPAAQGPLMQQALDQAFSRQQRQSNLAYKHDEWTVTIISGKSTDRLEVQTTSGSQSETLQATSIERTLIDITVRPSYAGGITEVLNAYKLARERVSSERLLRTLGKLDYLYPYHQAIGFLMQRAGYAKSQFDALHSLGINHKFYLVHGMTASLLDNTWQLLYPQELPLK